MKSKTQRVSHEVVKKRMLRDPAVRAEYDELMKDFNLVSELVRARLKANKTQSDVADAMHTTTSVISRLESPGSSSKHSPTIGTLKKYAAAVGCEIEFKLKPISKHSIESRNSQ